MPDPVPTPAKLLALRESAGLTQEHAARRAGLSVTSLWRYETGRIQPSSHVLRSLLAAYAHGLGVTLTEVVPATNAPDEVKP